MAENEVLIYKSVRIAGTDIGPFEIGEQYAIDGKPAKCVSMGVNPIQPGQVTVVVEFEMKSSDPTIGAPETEKVKRLWLCAPSHVVSEVFVSTKPVIEVPAREPIAIARATR